MIITNIQINKKNQAIASQAEGHEFEPRLPLKRRHSLIIMLLTDNRECFFVKTNYMHSKIPVTQK